MVRDQIVDETVASMIQPAYINETGALAIGLFDKQGNHIFTIQPITAEASLQLVKDLRQWLKQGIDEVRERERGLATTRV